MSDHPLPQDEYGSVERNLYGLFKCVDCYHRHAANIPALFEDLPACPICLEPSVIHSILMAQDDLVHDYYFSDHRMRREITE